MFWATKVALNIGQPFTFRYSLLYNIVCCIWELMFPAVFIDYVLLLKSLYFEG